eukprot:3934300-Rhodomonas_salina.2
MDAPARRQIRKRTLDQRLPQLLILLLPVLDLLPVPSLASLRLLPLLSHTVRVVAARPALRLLPLRHRGRHHDRVVRRIVLEVLSGVDAWQGGLCTPVFAHRAFAHRLPKRAHRLPQRRPDRHPEAPDQAPDLVAARFAARRVVHAAVAIRRALVREVLERRRVLGALRRGIFCGLGREAHVEVGSIV